MYVSVRALNYPCVHLHMWAIRVHIPCIIQQIRGTAGPGRALSPSPCTAESCLLCISHRSGGRGVGITVGLHIRPLWLVSPPADSPRSAQDVLSVVVSTSPSGHIPDIWTAAGARRSGRRKRGGRRGDNGWMRWRRDQNRTAGKRGRQKGGEEEEMLVNSLLCRLLSWMNEAQH